VNGIDTAVAEAVDRLIERVRNRRAYRKARKAEAAAPPPEENGDHDDK
jgi:hypothetical protein